MHRVGDALSKTSIAGPYAGRLTLSYVFSSAWLKVGGWMVLLSSLGTAVITAVSIAVIVSKTQKQCICGASMQQLSPPSKPACLVLTFAG